MERDPLRELQVRRKNNYINHLCGKERALGKQIKDFSSNTNSPLIILHSIRSCEPHRKEQKFPCFKSI